MKLYPLTTSPHADGRWSENFGVLEPGIEFQRDEGKQEYAQGYNGILWGKSNHPEKHTRKPEKNLQGGYIMVRGGYL